MKPLFLEKWQSCTYQSTSKNYANALKLSKNRFFSQKNSLAMIWLIFLIFEEFVVSLIFWNGYHFRDHIHKKPKNCARYVIFSYLCIHRYQITNNFLLFFQKWQKRKNGMTQIQMNWIILNWKFKSALLSHITVQWAYFIFIFVGQNHRKSFSLSSKSHGFFTIAFHTSNLIFFANNHFR